VEFENVKANLITDKMTIKIASIDGVNAETAARNKRVTILTEAEYGQLPEIITESRKAAIFEITKEGTITAYSCTI
jgi:hypothetical protein